MVDIVGRWTDELARNPDSLSFLRLADELRRRRALPEARTVALRGLERHPYLADAHDMLARVYADDGETQRARDEWEMALRIDPDHLESLKGLGFLAFARGDLAGAERHLRRARSQGDPDAGLATAHRRVMEAMRRASRGHPEESVPHNGTGTAARNGNGSRPRAAAPPNRARELFAPLLGEEDGTALLIDADGLVIAGAYVDETGREIGDEIGAELSGVSDEAARALIHLRLGTWESLLIEAQHATVGLAPARDGAVVLVAAARDAHVGLVRRLLMQARTRARTWMAGAS